MKGHEHAAKNKPATQPAQNEVAEKANAEGKTLHAEPDHQDHHAHMAADFRMRFWISLVLTLIALGSGALTLVIWLAFMNHEFAFAIERAVTVMVITCPRGAAGGGRLHGTGRDKRLAHSQSRRFRRRPETAGHHF
jgi:hypothetical protein